VSRFCCPMRARFIVGPVGIRLDQPEPVDVADFILDWRADTPGAKPVIAIRFCPFCGREIHHKERRDIVEPGAP